MWTATDPDRPRFLLVYQQVCVYFREFSSLINGATSHTSPTRTPCAGRGGTFLQHSKDGKSLALEPPAELFICSIYKCTCTYADIGPLCGRTVYFVNTAAAPLRPIPERVRSAPPSSTSDQRCLRFSGGWVSFSLWQRPGAVCFPEE